MRLVIFALLFAVLASMTVFSADFKMLTHTANNFAEQDVYVSMDQKSSLVTRPNGSTDFTLRLFSSDLETQRDPYLTGISATFPKGRDLGFSLRDWLKAIAEAKYTCDGQKSTFQASFTAMVPNSLYSIWYFQSKLPPGYSAIELPIGNENGTQNLFWTDSFGNAKYFLEWEGCLPKPTRRVPVGIMAIYHSDNSQKGVYAGEVGKNSHAHILGFLPESSVPVLENTESRLADSFIVFIAGAILAIFVGMSYGKLIAKRREPNPSKKRKKK